MAIQGAIFMVLRLYGVSVSGVGFPDIGFSAIGKSNAIK